MTRKNQSAASRRGTIAVLSAIMLVILVGMVAFAVDLGYLQATTTEMRRTADASALAAAWELMDDIGPTATAGMTDEIAAARALAVQFAAANPVCRNATGVDINANNAATGDILVGYIADPSNPNSPMLTDNPDKFNAVRVRVRKTSEMNGEIPMFFGRVFGRMGQASSSEATAALLRNLKGFRIPQGETNLDLLPFALDKVTWDNLKNNNAGTDQWEVFYENNRPQVRAGSDGIREVNLFPQGTGSPGNRGTVDIGSNNNSTNDLCRQIRDGVSTADLAYHGGKLELGANGTVTLNGDTGISAGTKDDLSSIIGQPRIIPIFSSVSGNGNNANYTIVEFVGVQVLEVKLTGSMSGKKVMIQPCKIVVRGGIPSTAGQTSTYVFSPAWLIR